VDLGDCDRLFRSLKRSDGPTGTRQQAALELLGLSSACPTRCRGRSNAGHSPGLLSGAGADSRILPSVDMLKELKSCI